LAIERGLYFCELVEVRRGEVGKTFL